MKKTLSLIMAILCLTVFSSIILANYLKPGEALIKRTLKKTAINVLAIDYCPIKSGTLKIEIYDENSVLLAAQKERVETINNVATAVIYVADPLNTDTITAILNGAGFRNKKISYSNEA